MTRLYECSVRYEKMHENGTVKKVTEQYLVDALTFTEAEARIIECVTPFISGEFDVIAIKRTKYSEIVSNDPNADKWFKAKLNFVTLNEVTGIEKKVPSFYIVNADSFDDAKDVLRDFMKGTVADYEVATLDETKIIDVFKLKINED